jgi:hypothetical protein
MKLLRHGFKVRLSVFFLTLNIPRELSQCIVHAVDGELTGRCVQRPVERAEPDPEKFRDEVSNFHRLFPVLFFVLVFLLRWCDAWKVRAVFARAGAMVETLPVSAMVELAQGPLGNSMCATFIA